MSGRRVDRRAFADHMSVLIKEDAQRGKHWADALQFHRVEMLGQKLEVGTKRRDDFSPQRLAFVRQPHLFRSTIIRVGPCLDEAILFQTLERVGHRRLGDLKGPRHINRSLAVAHPGEVVQNGKMRRNEPIRHPRLKERAAELFDDSDFVEDLEKDSRIRIRHPVVLPPVASAACAAFEDRSPADPAFELFDRAPPKLHVPWHSAAAFRDIPAGTD